MKTSKLLLSAAVVAIAAFQSCLTTPAHADTYQIFDLGTGHRRTPLDITSSGEVIVFDSVDVCNNGGAGCYETWVNGVLTSTLLTLPNLDYDNGEPCVGVVTLGTTGPSRCNNGHDVFGKLAEEVLVLVPINSVVLPGIGAVVVDSMGDYAATVNLGDPNSIDADGELIEGIDLTSRTPEPSSIALVATGLILALGSMRRHVFPAR